MFKLRILASALAFAVLAIAAGQVQPAAAAAAPVSEADSVVRFARAQLGKPFKLGTSGMRRFDCSGLVWRSFYERGLAGRIGGDRTSRGYYAWAKRNGRITSSPRVGDLVVWAKRGQPVSHIGIYIGRNRYNQPMALSALTGGVAVHKVHGINKPARAYIRVNLGR